MIASGTHPGHSGGPQIEDGVKPVINRADKPEGRYAAAPSGIGSESAVPVVSCWPAVLVIDGTPSGAVYRWDRGGATVAVRPEDVEYLRTFNRQGNERACCGGGARTYFAFANGG